MSTSHELVIISDEVREAFPAIAAGADELRRCLGVKTWEDYRVRFLLGYGNSPNTTRSYEGSARAFWDFSEHMHPFQVTAAHIEAWYDAMKAEKKDLDTLRLRIAGLKAAFKGIASKYPFFQSPFDKMSEKLLKKLQKNSKGNKTKKALTAEEVKKVLSFLDLDRSEAGLCNRALVHMAATCGLRASELTGLRWGDLDFADGVWTARFTGKGSKEAAQELYTPAVESCRLYARSRFRRDPIPSDPVFWTAPSFSGQERAPMGPHVMWDRTRLIGKAVRQAGIVTRELQWSPHLFRRTYATMLYKGGMGLRAVMVKTRHSSIETLCRHYVSDETPATPFLEKALA